jgi:hypothetical protein
MPGTPGDLGLSPEQLHNATIIAGVGTLRGASRDDITTALAVALAESELEMYANSNVPESLSINHDKVGSDHNSVGLFQQQVGIWGSAGDLMNPAGSAKKFYDALSKAPAGSRETRAQAVQKSAFSDGRNYAARLGQADQLYAAVVDGQYDPSKATLDGKPRLNADTPAAWVAGVTRLGETLGSAEFWRRAGMFALGAALLVLVLVKITGTGSAVASAGKAAAKAAVL